VLLRHLVPALKKLNPKAPAEAIDAAVNELIRDRSVMSLAAANREVYGLLKNGVKVDIRIITASNRILREEVRKGNFREDLFYRINVVQIELPPLRARGTDVLFLAQHFLQEAAARSGKRVVGLSESAAERLLTYTGRGTFGNWSIASNVR
jgi:sigma54-dependent transcription regulator